MKINDPIRPLSTSAEPPLGLPGQPLCHVVWAGQVDYAVAWEWQHALLRYKQTHPDAPDWLLLLEHPSTYTLGQGASLDFLKFDPTASSVPVHRIERGGEVTYHTPGQLVGYPILDLRRYQQDLHWYLRQLEEVVIRAIATHGIMGDRIDGLTGVWVEGYKVAAIGIKVSRWITMHGFAVNVCPNLAGFQRIVPCGIVDKPVGKLAQWQPSLSLDSFRPALVNSFADVFGVVTHATSLQTLLESDALLGTS